ncbi:hypothetical protein H1D32_22825 [Anaerobacillus sp. CMMVII]|uniref:hypothetical protein n=1 Tax=Anaerobacillus sp. CMMVII TaxID=2755588 RepID=UPI0021B82790|nr:hypothetical protein [Anaerobacillus sp. CMMVII]MCT8140281.1 hypothetical protein [Anaerobacillus sp. CMMVII]
MNKNTKKALHIMGMLIFGGWFITSFIEAANSSIKYSTYTIWEFRLFIVGCAAIFYLQVFFFDRKVSKSAENPSQSKAS